MIGGGGKFAVIGGWRLAIGEGGRPGGRSRPAIGGGAAGCPVIG